MLIIKKSKKIDTILPVIAELQVQDVDALNFEVFWDPTAYDKQHPGSHQNSSTAPFRLSLVCNHAQEKKTLLERLIGIKRLAANERNTFANQKSHAWVWHYSAMVPKCAQTKPSAGAG